MKYQIGDHVKYDSGEWWFFGTITAVIGNSINPCYRLIVDRMVKKDCRFSLTPFEFELLPDEESAAGIDSNKWEAAIPEQSPIQPPIQPPIQIPIQPPIQIPIQPPIQPAVKKPAIKHTPKQKPNVIPKPTPKSQPAKQQPAKTISEEPKSDIIEVIQASPAPIKYKVRDLSFEPALQDIKPKKSKNQNKSYQRNSWWDNNIKQWKTGRYDSMKSWRQKCVKLYVTGKLPQFRIDQLKEIGILH